MDAKIGEHIKRMLVARKIKLKDFAEDLGMARQNVYRIFEKDSIETDLLIKVSAVLNHNFFQYFDQHALAPLPDEVPHAPGVHTELESCKSELRLAKKEIDYLKKIIDLMEERTKWLSSQQQPVDR